MMRFAIAGFAIALAGCGLQYTPDHQAAYERQMAKTRYFSRQRYAHPETTIRAKSSRRRRRR